MQVLNCQQVTEEVLINVLDVVVSETEAVQLFKATYHFRQLLETVVVEGKRFESGESFEVVRKALQTLFFYCEVGQFIQLGKNPVDACESVVGEFESV